MSVSSQKQKDFAILWFSTWAAFTGHCSCRFQVGFSVVVALYSYIVEYAFFKVWSEDKLNKKFVVAENFAERVSKGKRFCLYPFISWVTCLKGGGFDPLWSSNGWGIWPSNLATYWEILPKFFKKVKFPGVCPGGGGWRFWNWPVHKEEI